MKSVARPRFFLLVSACCLLTSRFVSEDGSLLFVDYSPARIIVGGDSFVRSDSTGVKKFASDQGCKVIAIAPNVIFFEAGDLGTVDKATNVSWTPKDVAKRAIATTGPNIRLLAKEWDRLMEHDLDIQIRKGRRFECESGKDVSAGFAGTTKDGSIALVYSTIYCTAGIRGESTSFRSEDEVVQKAPDLRGLGYEGKEVFEFWNNSSPRAKVLNEQLAKHNAGLAEADAAANTIQLAIQTITEWVGGGDNSSVGGKVDIVILESSSRGMRWFARKPGCYREDYSLDRRK